MTIDPRIEALTDRSATTDVIVGFPNALVFLEGNRALHAALR